MILRVWPVKCRLSLMGHEKLWNSRRVVDAPRNGTYARWIVHTMDPAHGRSYLRWVCALGLPSQIRDTGITLGAEIEYGLAWGKPTSVLDALLGERKVAARWAA